MHVIRRMFTRGAVAGLLALLAAPCGVAPVHAGVTVSLLPGAQTVAPGSQFDITVQVTQAGSAFNGFDLFVEFDPTALTPVPLAPVSSQVGTLMSGACGNLFHVFHAGAAQDTVRCVMLCGGVSVTGPGTIYKLRFKAANSIRTTTLRFASGTAFFNGGLYVNPLVTHDAAIGIGMPATLDVGEEGGRLALSAAPNPSRGGATISFGAPLASAARLGVFDLQGRQVCRLAVSAGARSIAWDGRDADGRRVAPGRYAIALDAAPAAARTYLTVIR